MKKSFLVFLSLLSFIASFLIAQVKETTEGMEGYWVIEQKGKPLSVIALYSYEGSLYGKIIVALEKDGSIYTEKGKGSSEKLKVQPNDQGLDVLWGGERKVKEKTQESRWVNSRFMDPTGPKLYGAELYRVEGISDLKVRVYLLGSSWLGGNLSWKPLDPSILPSEYSLPDLNTLKPEIYREFEGR